MDKKDAYRYHFVLMEEDGSCYKINGAVALFRNPAAASKGKKEMPAILRRICKFRVKRVRMLLA